MPFSSPKRKISDTENKLRVLFCLDALGTATQEQLWPFVAQLELMEYVPFCMFVADLKNDGALEEASHALEGALYLTPQGRQQLSLFREKLPYADRRRIAEQAPAYAAQLSARRQITAVYEGAEGCVYGAACSVREDDVPTLFLRVSTVERQLADQAVKGFRDRAPHLLTMLYTLPFEPYAGQVPAALQQETALLAAAPGKAALCAFGGRKHAAVVSVADGDTCYTVLLLLPDAALAWGWALAADAEGCRLAQRITAVLTAEEV